MHGLLQVLAPLVVSLVLILIYWAVGQQPEKDGFASNTFRYPAVLSVVILCCVPAVVGTGVLAWIASSPEFNHSSTTVKFHGALVVCVLFLLGYAVHLRTYRVVVNGESITTSGLFFSRVVQFAELSRVTVQVNSRGQSELQLWQGSRVAMRFSSLLRGYGTLVVMIRERIQPRGLKIESR